MYDNRLSPVVTVIIINWDGTATDSDELKFR